MATDPSPATAWRPMQLPDIDSVSRLAADIHPDFPESDDVLREKLSLFPQGCSMLMSGKEPAGYILSHPWTRGCPAPLDNLLEALPDQPDAFYIHDLALSPGVRGLGMADQMVGRTLALAQALNFETITLVSVGNAASFWKRHGFAAARPSGAKDILTKYGPDASYMERQIDR